MATSVAFDTHGAVKRLERAGFRSEQAEALTETLRLLGDSQRSDLATKADLLEMEGRLNQSVHDLQSRMTRAMFSALLAVVALTTGLTVALIKLL